jgi:hypothetical protein
MIEAGYWMIDAGYSMLVAVSWRMELVWQSDGMR